MGWTFSYIYCIFVHPDLDSVPLFVGMRERSIANVYKINAFKDDLNLFINLPSKVSWAYKEKKHLKGEQLLKEIEHPYNFMIK